MKFSIFLFVLVVAFVVVNCVPNNGKSGQGGKPSNGSQGNGTGGGQGGQGGGQGGQGGKPSSGGKGNGTDDGCGNKPKAACEKLKERKEKLNKRKQEAIEKFKKMTKKASQRDKKVGDSVMRVDKEGAKIAILREGQFFEIKMKQIKEKVANKTEPNEYNLRKVNFNVTKNGEDNSTYNVSAGVVILKGQLNNGAYLKFYLYMFNTSANVTGEDGNEYRIVPGGLKANFELDWPNEVEYIEVKIAVKCGFEMDKGRKPKTDKENRGIKGKNNIRGPKTYSVCPNARMTFSPSYISNGTRMDMDNEYPKPEELSSDDEAVVSLKFNGVKKMFYDPTAEGGDDIGDDPLQDSTPSTAFISAKPNLLLTMFIASVFSFAKLLM